MREIPKDVSGKFFVKFVENCWRNVSENPDRISGKVLKLFPPNKDDLLPSFSGSVLYDVHNFKECSLTIPLLQGGSHNTDDDRTLTDWLDGDNEDDAMRCDDERRSPRRRPSSTQVCSQFGTTTLLLQSSPRAPFGSHQLLRVVVVVVKFSVQQLLHGDGAPRRGKNAFKRPKSLQVSLMTQFLRFFSRTGNILTDHHLHRNGTLFWWLALHHPLARPTNGVWKHRFSATDKVRS